MNAIESLKNVQISRDIRYYGGHTELLNAALEFKNSVGKCVRFSLALGDGSYSDNYNIEEGPGLGPQFIFALESLSLEGTPQEVVQRMYDIVKAKGFKTVEFAILVDRTFCTPECIARPGQPAEYLSMTKLIPIVQNWDAFLRQELI